MAALSPKSEEKLIGVKPELVRVVKEAIKISLVDFGISEGLRSLERQKQLVSEGKSRTLASKHLSGDAVDLFAYVENKVSWEEKHYYVIARAMQVSAKKFATVVGWGAVWDISLNNLSSDLETEVKKYQARFKIKNPNKKPFFDGVHFELRAQ